MQSKISASDILTIIHALSCSDEYIRTIYKQGSCYRFFLFVKRIRSDATPLINREKDHILVMVDNVVFDIDGAKPAIGDYRPMTKEDIEMASKWSFAKRSFLSVGDCPYCGENI